MPVVLLRDYLVTVKEYNMYSLIGRGSIQHLHSCPVRWQDVHCLIKDFVKQISVYNLPLLRPVV